MTTEVFADTIGRIDFASGVVRFELVSLEPAGEGAGRMEVRQRVAMPIEGMLSAMNTMGQLVNKLIESGVVQRRAPSEQA